MYMYLKYLYYYSGVVTVVPMGGQGTASSLAPTAPQEFFVECNWTCGMKI